MRCRYFRITIDRPTSNANNTAKDVLKASVVHKNAFRFINCSWWCKKLLHLLRCLLLERSLEVYADIPWAFGCHSLNQCWLIVTTVAVNTLAGSWLYHSIPASVKQILMNFLQSERYAQFLLLMWILIPLIKSQVRILQIMHAWLNASN